VRSPAWAQRSAGVLRNVGWRGRPHDRPQLMRESFAGTVQEALRTMEEPWYVRILESVLGGVVAAALVYYFGIRELVIQRRLAFLERQLTEFYAPLAGMRKQIRSKSEFRQKVSAAASAAWQEVCLQYDGLPPNHEELFKPFKRIIEYDNEQLKADLVPQYRAMLALFTERYHLAARETRAFYEEFLNFVETWNRSLAESIPPVVLAKLGHSEEKVMAFYAHIDAKMQQLQDDIARGK